MVSNLCGIFLLVLVLCVYGEKDMRSNVAFVIDDTISMSLEISQVKARVQDVFAAVFASNKSQIGDFILITFNDNEVSTGDSEDYIEDDSLTPIVLRTVTRDPAEFLKKLGEIKVGGGGYCPELCLSGIKRAIEESNPNSYIYVFTDATAKDYEEEEIVKNLAHKKSIQITFLLTGDCDDTTSPEYTVYDRLAKATSGQVFHLQKDDINKIIDYITKTIENPGTTLAIEPINPGINEFNVTADTDMTDLNIAAGVDRGTKVNVNVIDPHGVKAPTKEIIKTDNSMVATVLNTTNGPYKIIVDSEGKGNIVVKASVNIDFRYGFRVLMPTSLKNTRTRPVSGMESHLAIKLDIFDDKVDAKLKKVLILDINNKQLMEMSANIIDEDSKFYVTAPFKPPNDSFKVAIIAVVQGTGEEITRIARTSVKAQKYSVNKIEPKSPEVVIERAPKISVMYGNSLTLECKVDAYPEPKIVWENKEYGTVLDSSASIIEVPYEYVSVLKIDNVTKTSSYECKASNNGNVVTDSIEVESLGPKFWNILQEPKDTNIDYEKDAEIYCKINAWPLPTINWYKADVQVTNDDHFHLSDDKMTLLVKKMLPELEGKYSCKASNEDNVTTLNFTITVSGGESPIIDKTNSSMTVIEGTIADIPCRVVKGFPTPIITWEFKEKDSSEFISLPDSKQELHIDAVSLKSAGVYKCKAKNRNGEDHHEIDLTVQCIPQIDKSKSKTIVHQGSKAVVSCRIIKGIPKPTITWEFKSKDTSDFKIIPKTEEDIIIDAADLVNSGFYRCIANNVVGKDTHETELILQHAPEIDKSEPTMETFFGIATDILCRVIRGSPEPDITWEFKKKDTADFKTIAETKQKIHIDSTRLEDAGVYRCLAKNVVGEDSHETELTVFDAPEIDKSEHTMETFFGTATDILCRVIRGSPEPDITWEFKTKDTADFKTLAETKQKIHIDSTRVEDAGVYRCKANNFVGEDSHETELTVFGLPEIDKSKSNITVNQGSKATISCRIIGGNPEPDITWEFKKKNTSDFETMSATEQDIVINAVDLENGGTYKCVASNYLGMDTHETEVTVQCAPVIDKSKTNRVAATLRSKANIQCRIIRGIPAPVITWEFRRQSASEFVPLPQTEQEIKIEPVDTDNAGVYKCQASNEVGKDFYRIELIVENAAFVVVEQPKPAKIGDQVTLHCEVTGEPEPNVRWIKEGKTITADKKYTIFTDNSLRFIASENDKGDYTCEARNYRGRDSKDVTLNIYGPVKIEPPKDTPRNVLVGSDVELLCDASGIPNPNISWIFLKSGSKDYPAILPPNGSNRLTLSKIQAKSAGSYVCIATNTFDTKSITYEVNVNAPVEIEKPEKTEFNVVEYDIALIIPCKAKGYPKPTVTWMVDGLPLTLDEMYDTDADGSLVIIRPDKSSEKKYVCTASNSLSYASQTFTVNVSPHPIPTWPMKTMYIEIGTTQDIKCDLPYTDLDVLTWYKNGTQLPVTNFRLIGAVEPDSGIYSCHVSSMSGSESSHVQIFVGAKPRFTHPEGNLNKAFLFGRKLYLDCYVTGTPTPTVTWWHNDTKLTDTSMLHIFTMYNSDLGEKRCEATNAFGTITRTYVISNIGCAIDFTERDLNKYHPLIVSGTGKLNQFENSDGIMIVPESVTVTFQCPRTVLKIKCFNKEFVGLDGTHRKYQDLKCDKEFRPRTKRVDHGEACSSDPTSALINVGYDTIGSFTIMYGVCYSKSKEKQVFTMYNLNRYASNIEIDSTKSFRKDYTRYNYNDMFNSDRVCRFTGRQLVNDRDLPPGLQKASHFNINVVPQWNLCGNSHNWDEVEKRIRDLAKTVKHTLLVFTGEHKSQKEFLEDRYGNKIKTSKYLWKVVQINEKRVSLAIITINEPNLRRANLRSLVFCDDICHRTDWMANTEWHNVKKGYTFCCNAWQLANAIDPAFQRIYKSKLLLRRTEL